MDDCKSFHKLRRALERLFSFASRTQDATADKDGKTVSQPLSHDENFTHHLRDIGIFSNGRSSPDHGLLPRPSSSIIEDCRHVSAPSVLQHGAASRISSHTGHVLLPALSAVHDGGQHTPETLEYEVQRSSACINFQSWRQLELAGLSHSTPPEAVQQLRHHYLNPVCEESSSTSFHTSIPSNSSVCHSFGPTLSNLAPAGSSQVHIQYPQLSFTHKRSFTARSSKSRNVSLNRHSSIEGWFSIQRDTPSARSHSNLLSLRRQRSIHPLGSGDPTTMLVNTIADVTQAAAHAAQMANASPRLQSVLQRSLRYTGRASFPSLHNATCQMLETQHSAASFSNASMHSMDPSSPHSCSLVRTHVEYDRLSGSLCSLASTDEPLGSDATCVNSSRYSRSGFLEHTHVHTSHTGSHKDMYSQHAQYQHGIKHPHTQVLTQTSSTSSSSSATPFSRALRSASNLSASSHSRTPRCTRDRLPSGRGSIILGDPLSMSPSRHSKTHGSVLDQFEPLSPFTLAYAQHSDSMSIPGGVEVK